MKIYTKEEALKESTQYFNGDKLAADVFVNKYAMKNDKLELVECTPEQMHRRLAKEFARIEKKYPNPISEEEIFGLFDRFRYVCPQGSPMFGIGNVYSQRTSLSNCFVIDVVDSYGGICRADERIAQIAKRRGGIGLNISSLRPKGMPTKNSALTTDGIVVFMERFSNTSREVAQAGRRGALMISISVHHPEVLNFIRAKRDLGKINGANISVQITDEFMRAVQKRETYEQRWPVDSNKPIIKQEVKAKEIWDELVKSNWLSAEPGILFWDTIIKNSPADSYADVGYKTVGTNPCLSGDTLVYVADGRGNVPIKQLALEGKDVSVFCYNNVGQVIIKTMRHPRVTGYKQPIYKITLDDGYVIRCTGNHKVLLKNGQHKEAKDLNKGDSLKTIVRYESPMPAQIKQEKSGLYYWIANGFRNIKAEHRYIVESKLNIKLTKKDTVHHKNYNGLDNSIDNLEVLSIKDHSNLHTDSKMGDNNPMRRAKYEWSKQKWQDYHNNMSEAVKCEKNGRYLGVTNEELKQKAIGLTVRLGHRFSYEEWQNYAKENKLPVGFSDWREKAFGGILGLAKMAAKECNLKNIDEDPRTVKVLEEMIEQNYDAKILNGEVIVKKICEGCNKEFWTTHYRREVSFCDKQCYNKKITDKKMNIFTLLRNKLSRIPKKEEWEKECRTKNVPCHFNNKFEIKNYSELKEKSEYYNHRVVSVELDGVEDVYNGTVDEFHNFFIGGFKNLTKNKKYRKWMYINNKNCGELPLASNNGSCILLLQNLTSYVLDPFTDKAKFNIDLFKKNTRTAQRLIDDLVDLEIEAVLKIIDKIKNDPEDEKIKANELDLWMGVKKTAEESRRTGLGLTGLGDCLAMLNIKYGSKESFKIVEEIYSTLRDEAYRSSIEMAKERGSFPIWDHKKEIDNKFLNRLPEDIQKEIKKYGRRNIACLTGSPAGSVSTQTQTTSGFEPVFLAEYKRKRKLNDNDKEKPDFTDDKGDKWKEYTVTHHGLSLFKQVTGKEFKDSPYYGSQASEIDYEARVKLQALATKYTDHAISSTVNLPNDVDVKTVDKLYMLAWESGCKGLTVYRDGSRDGVLTKDGSKGGKTCEDCNKAGEEFSELVKNGFRPDKVIVGSAPKRPEVIECEIHRSKVGGGDWLFFVGMYQGQPYEVFGGDAEEFPLSLKYKKGWILKNGKNKDGITQYNLVLGTLDEGNDRMEVKGIAKHFNNKEYGAFTRIISLALRHGVPIKYMCEQLIKTGCAGDLFSFQRAIARVLKKYIAEGEAAGTECPQCHSDKVIYKNGCPTCQICGHSNCS